MKRKPGFPPLRAGALARRILSLPLLLPALLLLAMPGVQAQLDVKVKATNVLRGNATAENPVNPLQLPPGISSLQFSAVGITAAASTATSDSVDRLKRFPKAVATDGTTLLLEQSQFGHPVVSGPPLYSLGDEIFPPMVKADGAPLKDKTEAAAYWRATPVQKNEVFNQPGGATQTPWSNDPSVYWSPHAKKVFANQAGGVKVMWVTAVPQGNPRLFQFKEDQFTVASTTSRPVRQIFWTERGFNCPPIQFNGGQIQAINPVWSTNFPREVAQMYRAPGSLPIANEPEEKRTLWPDIVNGLGNLRCYNREGRIFVEYLGQVLSPGVHQWLGADVIEVRQVMNPTYDYTLLGEQLQPPDEAANVVPPRSAPLAKKDPNLIPSLVPSSSGVPYTASVTSADGATRYFAERENQSPDNVVVYWLDPQDAGIHFLTSPAKPGLSLKWPKYQSKYRLVWPQDSGAKALLAGTDPLLKYEHVTVPKGGSNQETGVQFNPESIPSVIFQDGGGNARINGETSQRLVVTIPSAGAASRSLLKFTNAAGDPWYVRIYTQDSSRTGFEEGDVGTKLTATVKIGARIPAPAGYAVAGYLADGKCHHPGAYKDPFLDGVEAAAAGAIIPVNRVPRATLPGYESLTVWWFKAVTPTNPAFRTFYVPAKVGTYTVDTAPTGSPIILASNAGSGDLSPSQIAGRVYIQNDSTKPGFNPNEEHALLIAGRVYALRDDLNLDQTSKAAVLLDYMDPADNRPSMAVFPVVRETAEVKFNYPQVAGTQVAPPMPLPLLPLGVETNDRGEPKIDGDGNQAVKNREIGLPTDKAPNSASAARDSDKFTFKDRKGYDWVYRGPHDSAIAAPRTFQMQFWYPMQDGFYIPDTTEPLKPRTVASGYPLPYLRAPNSTSTGFVGDVVDAGGNPLNIIYTPRWPAVVPELRVGESLALAKFGLPAVRGQSSVQIGYEQSFALATAKKSVRLHDPTRLKTADLKARNLDALPSSLPTTFYQGKTYFEGLPPHLQERLYYDPQLGAKGALVLRGEFVDEISGEDYLQLNVLSVDDIAAAKKALPAAAPAADKTAWEGLVDALATTMERFVPNPANPSEFIPGTGTGDSQTVAKDASAAVSHPDVAVDSYALTATGEGAGFVTLFFGNGEAFSPEGDPVSCAIIRVAPRLYQGDLKVLPASNPFDEQTTLRHSGDFAARPQDYEFEWRYSPPADGQPPKIYTTVEVPRLGSSHKWKVVTNPRPTTLTTQLTNAGTTTLSTVATIRRLTGSPGYDERVGGVLLRTDGSDTATKAVLNFTAATLPANLVFSADLPQHAGFVLYVNGQPAIRHNVQDPPPPSGQTASPGLLAPDPSFLPVTLSNVLPATGLAPSGLSMQWALAGDLFKRGTTAGAAAGDNVLTVVLYSTAAAEVLSSVNFRLDSATETDKVIEVGTPWLRPNGTLGNVVTVGGSPTAPLGSPLLVMADNYFTLRYRPAASSQSVAERDGTGYKWSRWTQPKLIEGWVKRVLAAINPYNQRSGDLFNNAVNSDVSLLTQAGKRWEGDVPLTLGAVNDSGLIEIYETVFNRAKNLSIGNGYDYAPANDALLLVAGYLADLYRLLGDEAYADAANSTVSLDDGAGNPLEVSTARYSFEGQLSSVLDEELALLRGRDDFLTPGVRAAPFYNRLPWNYTRGIDSGEVIYATNYNIREKPGGPYVDGKIDAQDAFHMFPQGHGDAYGHYLTVLTSYYKLLTNPYFTWTPRSEAVTILGQAISVDYMDERKFAAAAAGLARAAREVISLTHRKAYNDNPATGWAGYRDGKLNSSTSQKRSFGMDEWAVRSTAGAYLHWVTGNAMLPDKDTDPTHTGIQVIDRSTVPELKELTALAASIQTTADAASARLNPLGLAPDAVTFDISSADLKAGQSHYEQIYQRALTASLNAKGAFDAAARQTRLLRSQQNQVTDIQQAIQDAEESMENQLIGLYGTAYPGETGPGKTYAQGYAGPDILHWYLIDRPVGWEKADPQETVKVQVWDPVEYNPELNLPDLDKVLTTDLRPKDLVLESATMAAYADRYPGMTNPGRRRVVGALQSALLDTQEAMLDLKQTGQQVRLAGQRLSAHKALFIDLILYHKDSLSRTESGQTKINNYLRASVALSGVSSVSQAISASLERGSIAIAEALPLINGIDNDYTSVLRGAVLLGGALYSGYADAVSVVSQIASETTALKADETSRELDLALAGLDFRYEEKQAIFELKQTYEEVLGLLDSVNLKALAVQRSTEAVRNLMAEGDRLQADRESFRQTMAVKVQTQRTRDVTFRLFRNEALEQYRTLFDLSSRYAYLAAKSYDYETGLLGSAAGSDVFNRIVSSRALGDLTGGIPVASVSTRGDGGLAGMLAQLQSDWSVAKGRLGINNPDRQGTLFSLRTELFRVLPTVAADAQWRQVVEQHIVSNLLSDKDVVQACILPKKPDALAVPGLIIPFRTTVQPGLNFFGLPIAGGDHLFTASSFATKIYSVGVALKGYQGMDVYASGNPLGGGVPGSSDPNALSATPYVYLIPAGIDQAIAPPLGGTGQLRAWNVADQALPLPYNLGATAFNTGQYFDTNDTLTEQPWIARKHQAFRAVNDGLFFYSSMPEEFTSSRLVGRSVWNSNWKLVIPAYSLLADETAALTRFAASVKDIQVFLRTYSYSGN